MLLVGADHWQQLEQLVELDHAPAAPVAAGWMGPATVLSVTTVLVESVAARSLGLSRTQRRCRRAMRPRLEPSGGLWEQHGAHNGRRRGIDEFSRTKRHKLRDSASHPHATYQKPHPHNSIRTQSILTNRTGLWRAFHSQ